MKDAERKGTPSTSFEGIESPLRSDEMRLTIIWVLPPNRVSCPESEYEEISSNEISDTSASSVSDYRSDP